MTTVLACLFWTTIWGISSYAVYLCAKDKRWPGVLPITFVVGLPLAAVSLAINAAH